MPAENLTDAVRCAPINLRNRIGPKIVGTIKLHETQI